MYICTAVLADGMYVFKPKMSIWVILERLAMKDVDKFCGHFVYFAAI
jgi:hypothetical protein